MTPVSAAPPHRVRMRQCFTLGVTVSFAMDVCHTVHYDIVHA